MHFETIAVHAAGESDETTGAVAPPMHLSTTFARGEDGQPLHGYSYIRDGNPTLTSLEEALAQIDSGKTALAFSSGVAAAAAVFQALPPGSHVILPEDCYHGVAVLGREFLPSWGATVTFVAMNELESLREAMRDETRLIWGESPSNPLLTITNLREVAAIARSAGAWFLVDGTFASPAIQRPIELGADLVLHSTTKYLGGHSDVQGGSIAFREAGDLYEKIRHVRHATGGVLAPFNAWLVLRGIRSLAARMKVHSENALAIAEYLASADRVSRVNYPWLESHPGHAIAKQQMSSGGGMLSFHIRGSKADVLAVCARTRLFTRATSLGGVESLIEHRNTSEGVGSRTPEDLVRVSVGLESAEDLIADLAAALAG